MERNKPPIQDDTPPTPKSKHGPGDVDRKTFMRRAEWNTREAERREAKRIKCRCGYSLYHHGRKWKFMHPAYTEGHCRMCGKIECGKFNRADEG